MCLFFGIILLALCNSFASGQNTQLTVDITKHCPNVLYRLDEYTEVLTTCTTKLKKKNTTSDVWWKFHKGACRMSFMTDFPDHVICVNIYNIEIKSSDVTLKFFTSSYRPERIYTKKHSRAGTWCTDHNLLTVDLVNEHIANDKDSGIDVTFQVTNVTRNDVHLTYFMDSAEQCDVTYILPNDGYLNLETHRFPQVDKLPTSCMVKVMTDSMEEHARVCVNFRYFNFSSISGHELVITEVDEEYYKTNSTRYTGETEADDLKEVCSVGRELVFTLTRGQSKGGFFELNVSSKWTPFWEKIESRKSQLRTLGAAKGFTMFIATVDTLLALGAAFISMSTRFPVGPLQWVAETFSRDTDSFQQGPGCLEPPPMAGEKAESPKFDFPTVVPIRDNPI